MPVYYVVRIAQPKKRRAAHPGVFTSISGGDLTHNPVNRENKGYASRGVALVFRLAAFPLE